MTIASIFEIRRASSGRQPLELGLYHLAWMFLICSFLGLAGETLASYVVDGRWESRAGYVIGPLSPLYGLGAVVMTVALNPLRNRNAAVQFLVAAALGGAVEYFAGWFFETRYGIVAWSYISQPFNLHGRTCLAVMVMWGVLGVVWADMVLPWVVKQLERVPEDMRKPLTAGALVFIVADSVLTLVCLDCWFWRMAGYAPGNPVQEFCALYFGDEFMSARFETMSMWPVLASR